MFIMSPLGSISAPPVIQSRKMCQLVQLEAAGTGFHVQIIHFHKISIYTSQKTQYISIRKTNLVMSFMKIIGTYCKIHTEHTEISSGEIQGLFIL